MATREENTKKINDELELMTDEELDEIAGGNIAQTAGNSKILYDYGMMNDYYGTITVTFKWKSKSAEVDEGWSKAGITCVTIPFDKNKYFLNGKQITREEAHNHLRANFKKIHSTYD